MSKCGLVILDRDGVINKDCAQFVRSPEQWQPIAGSLDAIVRLRRGGYRVAVATNQSGIARGLLDIAGLEAIHAQMQAMLRECGCELDLIVFCPHGPDEGCACRKPRPGLLQQISTGLRMSLQGVPFVGDSPRDLEAARAAGCTPVLVRTGNGLRTERDGADQGAMTFDDLAAFADAWLESPAGALRGSPAGALRGSSARVLRG